MVDGKLNVSARSAEEAAQKFLHEHGHDLFDLSTNQFTKTQVTPETETTQIIYEQSLNGLNVFGSRINLIVNSSNELIFASSEAASSEAQKDLPNKPKVSKDSAAVTARNALFIQLSRDGISMDGSSMPVSFFSESGDLVYWLRSGNTTLVYKFTIVLPKPKIGEYEIEVDAINGTVLRVQKLSIN